MRLEGSLEGAGEEEEGGGTVTRTYSDVDRPMKS
jgi:hypothetical protein